MRTLAFACALMAMVGLTTSYAEEQRMVLIEEFTNTG